MSFVSCASFVRRFSLIPLSPLRPLLTTIVSSPRRHHHPYRSRLCSLTKPPCPPPPGPPPGASTCTRSHQLQVIVEDFYA
ncbi:hypothetical protein PIB30_084389 [Stylosanthes scabra]|uniref:Uncharacterized protein n=1 Tax=Stylosanthes scabra TaxID=79078 RepID=A0ABU6QSS9_9FABA|nr:hypothetical protein [Stylosanthes scabra]